jgi:hypothetical protein
MDASGRRSTEHESSTKRSAISDDYFDFPVGNQAELGRDCVSGELSGDSVTGFTNYQATKRAEKSVGFPCETVLAAQRHPSRFILGVALQVVVRAKLRCR